jgi:hypothetical protein
MKRNKRGRIGSAAAVLVGILLLAGAVGGLCVETAKNRAATQTMSEAAALIEKMAPETEWEKTSLHQGEAMPSMTIQGNEYIGLMGTDSLEEKLPIMLLPEDETSDGNLVCSSGNLYDGDLVLLYDGLGGRQSVLTQLDTGDELTVTDMLGTVYRYEVTRAAEKQRTIDIDADEEHALALVLRTRANRFYRILYCTEKNGM